MHQQSVSVRPLTAVQAKHPRFLRHSRRHFPPGDPPRANCTPLFTAHLLAKCAAPGNRHVALPAHRLTPRNAHSPTRDHVPRARARHTRRGQDRSRRVRAMGADVSPRVVARPRACGGAMAVAPPGGAHRRCTGRGLATHRGHDVRGGVGSGVGVGYDGDRRICRTHEGGGRPGH